MDTSHSASVMKYKGHLEYRVRILPLVVTLQRRANVYISISPHFFKIHLLFPSTTLSSSNCLTRPWRALSSLNVTIFSTQL